MYDVSPGNAVAKLYSSTYGTDTMNEYTTIREVYICPWDGTVVKLTPREEHNVGLLTLISTHVIFSSCGQCVKRNGFKYESEERVRARELHAIEDTMTESSFYNNLLEDVQKSPKNGLTHSHETYSISGRTRQTYRI